MNYFGMMTGAFWLVTIVTLYYLFLRKPAPQSKPVARPAESQNSTNRSECGGDMSWCNELVERAAERGRRAGP